MFRRSTTALSNLSPALKFVVLQLGSKLYGCHLLSARPSYLPPPLTESHPHLKPPYYDSLFYHAQLDFITAFAKDKKWGWCETRPDIIIGFAPGGNTYSLAASMGVFLSLWAEINGKGARCPFPGSPGAWTAKSNDSSADMIARESIHLSLTLGEGSKGEGFNVADEKACRSWAEKWAVVCACFGLEGTPPPGEVDGETGAAADVRSYITTHLPVWRALEEKHGLKIGRADLDMGGTPAFEHFLLSRFDFDRQFDMRKIYESGFVEERSTKEVWGGVFDRMKRGRLIPS